jgi:flavin-dependent dehydrogenase
VLDRLAEVGVTGLLDDRTPVARLRLTRDEHSVERTMGRASYVVPRAVLDARLVHAAVAAGAVLLHHRARDVRVLHDRVLVDGLRAPVVVGADGPHSVVRRALGLPPGRRALAIRGYAPVLPVHRGAQVITFGTTRQPSYAWSFDLGDGRANVGYGEVLHDGAADGLSRAELLARLEDLLPGSSRDGTGWVGHHLPLSGPRWRPQPGRVLLAGDAAGLVNPMTGEGIYYAVVTGIEAGRAAAHALAAADPGSAGRRYARTTWAHLLPHLRHTAAAGRLSLSGRVLDAGITAAAGDQRVFDDLVELGLARGRITPRVARGLSTGLARRTRPPTPADRPGQDPPCAS